MFKRLGRWCFDNRRLVIGAWIGAFVLAVAANGAIGGSFVGQGENLDSESSDGFEVLAEYFGGGSQLNGQIVFEAEQGVADPAIEQAMAAFISRAGELEGITSIQSPYAEFGAAQIAQAGPRAGTIAFAPINFDPGLDQNETIAIGEELRTFAPSLPGLRIEYGGWALAPFEPPESELIGLAFAIVVLILAFGSVLAMGLPIAVALAGVGIGVSIATLLSNVLEMPDFATLLATMIGLGVGIDYALFIVTRHREGLHEGLDTRTSIVTAIDTAGRSVLFAGITVVVSLLGLLVMGLPFVTGLGVAAATTVLITMIASITLLPAVLATVDERLEVTQYRGLLAAGFIAFALLVVGLKLPLMIALGSAVWAAVILVAGSVGSSSLQATLPRRRTPPIEQTGWYRWSHVVQRNPWPAAIGGTLLLLLLAVPVLSLRLGFSDEGNYPEETSTKQAYDLISEGFGPGANGPLILTVEAENPADLAVVDGLIERVQATENVAAVSPPLPNDPDNPVAVLLQVLPRTSPQDAETSDLVLALRDDVVPAAIDGTTLTVNVTGGTASSIDFTDYLSARLPIFFAVVLLLSFLLLMIVFRSLLVPLKAVVMNLLSIGAAYGIIVAIFQWGWAKDLVGIGQGGPIEPFIPMMLFAIVFGLSMDYEVFLLSRIKENFDKTGNAQDSVADGLASTARVITAAAAIMVVVFGSFVLEEDRIAKLFGLGLALAIFLDATLVRMLLVPATMELLGAKNWWIPAWLDRLLPTIDVEGVGDDHHGGSHGSNDGDPRPPLDDGLEDFWQQQQTDAPRRDPVRSR